MGPRLWGPAVFSVTSPGRSLVVVCGFPSSASCGRVLRGAPSLSSLGRQGRHLAAGSGSPCVPPLLLVFVLPWCPCSFPACSLRVTRRLLVSFREVYRRSLGLRDCLSSLLWTDCCPVVAGCLSCLFVFVGLGVSLLPCLVSCRALVAFLVVSIWPAFPLGKALSIRMEPYARGLSIYKP